MSQDLYETLGVPRDADADEALFLDGEGHVSEASASNIFVVSGSALVTPPLTCGVLPGITRAAIVELAAAMQIEVLERAAELTAEAMPRLRSMRDLTRYWIEINQLENQADRIYRKLLAKLFSGEYDALTVLKLKDVIEELETAADAFEHVANTVETIVVKNG